MTKMDERDYVDFEDEEEFESEEEEEDLLRTFTGWSSR